MTSRPPTRGEVFMVSLDPTRGAEIQRTRPCVVVSPDELNAHLLTAIVAPLTTAGRPSPFRIACRLEGKSGQIVLDQIRTVDRERLIRRLGKLQDATFANVLQTLQEMFAIWRLPNMALRLPIAVGRALRALHLAHCS